MLHIPLLPFHCTNNAIPIQLKDFNIIPQKKVCRKKKRVNVSCSIKGEKNAPGEINKHYHCYSKVHSYAWSFFRERMYERPIYKYFLLIH